MTVWSTPTTVNAGDVLLADQWNDEVKDNLTHLTEWQDWSPTLTQGVTVSRTITYGRWCRANTRVWAQCFLTCSSSGTSGQVITVSLPLAASNGDGMACGSGFVLDGTTFYVGCARLRTTTTADIIAHAQTNVLGAAPSMQLTTNDQVHFTIFYEAA